MAKAMGVSVCYAHMGNQTSVILEASQHFCPLEKWKYSIWILTRCGFLRYAEGVKRTDKVSAVSFGKPQGVYADMALKLILEGQYFVLSNLHWQKKKHCLHKLINPSWNQPGTGWDNILVLSPGGSGFSGRTPPEWAVSRCKGEARSCGFRPTLCFKGDTKEERATKNLMKWLMPWHAPTVAAGELPEAANMSTPHFPVRSLLKC